MLVWVKWIAWIVAGLAIGARIGERRIVEALEAKGAVDPETATKLPLTNFVRKWHFRRLLNVGAVGETMMQLQYIKVVEYAAYRSRRRRRALIILPLVLGLGLLFYLLRTRA